jgi:hypothetical protein
VLLSPHRRLPMQKDSEKEGVQKKLGRLRLLSPRGFGRGGSKKGISIQRRSHSVSMVHGTVTTVVAAFGLAKKLGGDRGLARFGSLFSYFDGAGQSSSFPIQRIRDKHSPRKFDFGVFTQPGSKGQNRKSERATVRSASPPGTDSCTAANSISIRSPHRRGRGARAARSGQAPWRS